jgi:hypothetical protein
MTSIEVWFVGPTKNTSRILAYSRKSVLIPLR